MKKILRLIFIISIIFVASSERGIAQSRKGRNLASISNSKEIGAAFELYKSEAREFINDLSEAETLIRKWRQRRLSETFEQRLSNLENNLLLSNQNLISEYNKFKKSKGGDILDDSLLLRLAHLYFEGANLNFNKKMKDYNAQMSDFTAGRIKVAPQVPVPDYANAIFYAKQIITDFDNSPLADRAHYLIGYAYDEMGMVDKSAKVFELLITQFPHSLFADEVSWRLAEYYFNNMNYKEAKYYYSKLVQGNSIFKVKSIYKLGATYFASGEYKKSYDAFKILIDFVDTSEHPTIEDLNLFDEALSYMGALKTQGIELDLPIQYQAKIYQMLGEQFKRRADEKSMRTVYNEAIRKFPYASNIPELYSQLITSLENSGMYEQANELRDDFTTLMIKSEYWWAKNDTNQQAVFRAEDLLEEHLLKNAQYLAQKGYDKKSNSDLLKAKASYERFVKNYAYSSFAETAMVELADLEYYLKNYDSAANWYARVTQTAKSDAVKESAAYSYIWSKAKRVNYNPSVSRLFVINEYKLPTPLTNQEKVFEDAALFYLRHVDKGLRRQKILLKLAQIYSEKADIVKSENALNQLIADRASISLTTARAISFLESIYNVSGDWAKVKEVQELLPTLRMKTNLSELAEMNKVLFSNYELSKIEDLVSNEQYAEAIQKYKEYLTFNPRSNSKEYIYLKLSVLYRNINDFKNSSSQLSLLKTSKLSKEALFIEAKNYKSLGQFQKSADTFELFLKLTKNHVWKDEALHTLVHLRKGLKQWDKIFQVLNENIRRDSENALVPDLLESALILGRHKYISDFVSSYKRKDMNQLIYARAYLIQSLVAQKKWNDLTSQCNPITQIMSKGNKATAFMKYAYSWCLLGEVKKSITSGAVDLAGLVDVLNKVKSLNVSELISLVSSEIVLAAFRNNISDASLAAIAKQAWDSIKDTPFHPYAEKAIQAYSLVYKKSPNHIGQVVNWRLSLINAIPWKVPEIKEVPWDAVRSSCESNRFDQCLSGLEVISKTDTSSGSLLNLAIANINWGNDELGFKYLSDYFNADKWGPESVNMSYIFGLSDLKQNPSIYMPNSGDKFYAFIAESEKNALKKNYKIAIENLQRAIQENSQATLPYGLMARILFEEKYYTLGAMILEEGVVNTQDTEGLFALRAQVDATLRKYGRIGYTSELLEQGFLSAVGLSLTALKNNDKKMQLKIIDQLKDKKYWYDLYKISENIITDTKNSVPSVSENAHFTWVQSIVAQDKSNLQAYIQKVKNLGYINPLYKDVIMNIQNRDVAGENND